MTIKTIGIDLAKNVFELCGLDESGEILLRKPVRRDTLLRVVGEIPKCVIGIEACTGAFFWQRQFEASGHDVRIIAPQHVKLKALIRKAAARTHDELWQAVGHVCDLFTDEECYHFFVAAG